MWWWQVKVVYICNDLIVCYEYCFDLLISSDDTVEFPRCDWLKKNVDWWNTARSMIFLIHLNVVYSGIRTIDRSNLGPKSYRSNKFTKHNNFSLIITWNFRHKVLKQKYGIHRSIDIFNRSTKRDATWIQILPIYYNCCMPSE